MDNYAAEAVQSALQGTKAFCKFLSANDTGLTGGHQAGIYISKPSIPILFNAPGTKGQNMEKWVKIRWMDGNETDSRFIYYWQGTRNEYRITNFGRGFPYLRPDYTGALFVLVQYSPEDYQAFMLNTEDEIKFTVDARLDDTLYELRVILSPVGENAWKMSYWYPEPKDSSSGSSN